jgi:hypothetical protein
VARALDNGLEPEGIIDGRDFLLNTIKKYMEEISKGEKDRPNWNPRGVRHAAENITTFEIAWRTERKPASNSMSDPDIKEYLKAFRTRGNCWSHDNGD